VIAHEIKWSHYAEDDLLNLITYIAKDNPDAAQNLKNQLESKCECLQRFPMSGRPGRVKGTYELIINPNYALIYMIKSAEIRVLRILHTAQNWPP